MKHEFAIQMIMHVEIGFEFGHFARIRPNTSLNQIFRNPYGNSKVKLNHCGCHDYASRLKQKSATDLKVCHRFF
ncbi:hypothetical protein TSMEX_003307 [Taenia solium]|eukprot:TsM_000319600 transcript=TsM_000319600 gene=TsM_000319600